MNQNRKLSFPADNPEYFNVSNVNWNQGPQMTMATGTSRTSAESSASSRPALHHLDSINSDFMEPTTEVMESLKNIEKLAEKQNSKSRTKKRLGSLKRLLSIGSSRGSSSGVENEYISSPAGNQYSGSLPSTPTKIPSNTNPFRLSTDSAKSVPRVSSHSVTSSVAPMSPGQAGRTYYNVETRDSVDSKPPPSAAARTPLKSCKPPTGQSGLAQRQRGVSGGSNRIRSVSMSSGGPRQESVWPGMEAPTKPLLHPTCRGFKAKDMPGLVILFYGGCNISRQWRDWIGKELETSNTSSPGGQVGKLKVGGQRLEEFGELSGGSGSEEGQNRRCEEVVYHCDLVIVVISPKFISWLEKTKIVIGRILHPSRVLGLFVEARPDDITPAIANCLQTLPCWKTVVIEDSGDTTDFMIGQYCQEILQKQKALSQCPSEPKFKLFPRKLSPSQSKLLLMLDQKADTLDREQFQLKIIQDDFHYTIEDVKWIKDDLVQVEFPSVMFQSTMIASLVLSINETNYGSRQVKLENAATMLEKAWQHCVDPVTVLSEAFDVRFVNHQDIDEFLSANLEKKSRIPDLLDTKFKGCTSDHIGKDCCECQNKDHTNLLHFAANHGFSRLCHTLLVSGYKRYLKLPNLLGLTPAECAEKCGHHDLAQELRGQSPTSALHDYQYPSLSSSSALNEGEDGYLIPSVLPVNEYQIPSSFSKIGSGGKTPLVKPKTISISSDEFYQIPPTPVPLAATLSRSHPCQSPGTSVTSSSSTPPKYRMGRGFGYIEMLPPIRKAVSEPKTDKAPFIHPKSGSFSHFTATLPSTSSRAPGAVSREELIARYCQEKERKLSLDARTGSPLPYVRPGSSPPGTEESEDRGEGDLRDQRPGSSPPVLHSSQNILIPGASACRVSVSDSDSSPLDHYVHTDSKLDGCVYLPMEPPETDPELSLLTAQSASLQHQMLDPVRSKSLLNRLSPSRSKLMRSMRRKSGGSLKHDDNDNEIDPIKEDNECGSSDRLEQPVPVKTCKSTSKSSQNLRSEENVADSFSYYDVPRKLSRDSPAPVIQQQLNNNVFTQVKEKPKVIKNANEGAYENVIIKSHQN